MDRVCPVCGYSGSENDCPEHSFQLVPSTPQLRPTWSRPELVGAVLDARWGIVSAVGRTATSWLFNCRHRRREDPRGLEVIRTGRAHESDHLRRFHLESQAAAELDHTNTMRLETFAASDDGYLYRVTEHPPGRALSDVLHDLGPFTPAATLRVAREVAGSLKEAHGLGIIHRNISTDTVRLVNVRGLVMTKVVNYGVVAFVQEERRNADKVLDAIVGSPHHIAPEQVLNVERLRRKGGPGVNYRPVDAAADLYSLGAVLYQLLTGAPPFDGATVDEILKHQVQDEPMPLPERVGPHPIPPLLRKLVHKLLEKHPDKREVHTGRDLLEVLDRIP